MDNQKDFYRATTVLGELVYGELVTLDHGYKALADSESGEIIVSIDAPMNDFPYVSSQTLERCADYTDRNKRVLFENDRMNFCQGNKTLDSVLKYGDDEKLYLHILSTGLDIPFKPELQEKLEYTGISTEVIL